MLRFIDSGLRRCRWPWLRCLPAVSSCPVRALASRSRASRPGRPGSLAGQFHVSFTSDPRLATVRVQIADTAEAADFAVIDEHRRCRGRCLRDQRGAETDRDLAQPAGIERGAEPVIFSGMTTVLPISRVRAGRRRFRCRKAAALIVGARGGHPRLDAAVALNTINVHNPVFRARERTPASNTLQGRARIVSRNRRTLS